VALRTEEGTEITMTGMAQVEHLIPYPSWKNFEMEFLDLGIGAYWNAVPSHVKF